MELTDRELIEHLFGRVETLEGSLRAALDLAMGAIAALPEAQRPQALAAIALLQGDRMAQIDSSQGPYVRSLDSYIRNLRNGYDTHMRASRETLRQHGLS